MVSKQTVPTGRSVPGRSASGGCVGLRGVLFLREGPFGVGKETVETVETVEKEERGEEE